MKVKSKKYADVMSSTFEKTWSTRFWNLLHFTFPPFTLRSFTFPLFTCALSCCAYHDTASLSPGDAFFVEEMKPLLEQRCLSCHNGRVLEGRLNLESRATAFQPGPAGPFIVPGDPRKSKVFTVTFLDERNPQAMPPTGHGLSEVEVLLIDEWIRKGAPWPEGKPGHLKPPPGAEPRSVRADDAQLTKDQPA